MSESKSKDPSVGLALKVMKLRAALVGLIGMEAPELLRAMKADIQTMDLPEYNKKVTIAAIDALLETQ